MSNFDRNIVELGKVSERKTIKAEFKVISNREIVKVEPSCGCTPTTFNKKSLTLIYRTGNVPAHLQHIGQSVISKFADVFFHDGTKERVYMKATLVKKN